MKKDESKNKKNSKKSAVVIKEEDPKELSPRSKKYEEVYEDIYGINIKILEAGNNIDTIESRVLHLQQELN